MKKGPFSRAALLFSTVFFFPGVGLALVSELDPTITTHPSALNRNILSLFPTWKSFHHWNRMGRIERGTGVYLGDGKVLTAAHVGVGTFTTPDRMQYRPVEGSMMVFRNEDGSWSDMCLFRIQIPKGAPLADLKILPVRIGDPPLNCVLLMVGAGMHRELDSLRWKEDGQVRWGFNRRGQARQHPFDNQFGRTSGFYTEFGKGMLNCQAAPGDSGGAAFYFDPASQSWQLAGLILAGSETSSQSRETRIGDRTFIASLLPLARSPVKVASTSPSSHPRSQTRETNFTKTSKAPERRMVFRKRN